MTNHVLHLTPVDSKGSVALAIRYGEIEDGVSSQQFIAQWQKHIVYSILGPFNIPITIYVALKKGSIGPIFCEDKVIFSEFIILGALGIPLHCDECAQIVVRWFIDQQPIWAEKHHAHWWSINRESNGTQSQRLH